MATVASPRWALQMDRGFGRPNHLAKLGLITACYSVPGLIEPDGKILPSFPFTLFISLSFSLSFSISLSLQSCGYQQELGVEESFSCAAVATKI